MLQCLVWSVWCLLSTSSSLKGRKIQICLRQSRGNWICLARCSSTMTGELLVKIPSCWSCWFQARHMALPWRRWPLLHVHVHPHHRRRHQIQAKEHDCSLLKERFFLKEAFWSWWLRSIHAVHTNIYLVEMKNTQMFNSASSSTLIVTIINTL